MKVLSLGWFSWHKHHVNLMLACFTLSMAACSEHNEMASPILSVPDALNISKSERGPGTMFVGRIKIENNGSAPVHIRNVTLSEREDARSELSLVDAIDWATPTVMAPTDVRYIEIHWQIRDAQPDYATITIEANTGVHTVEVRTIDEDAFIEVESNPPMELAGEVRQDEELTPQSRVDRIFLTVGAGSDDQQAEFNGRFADITIKNPADIPLAVNQIQLSTDAMSPDGSPAFKLCQGSFAENLNSICLSPQMTEPLEMDGRYTFSVIYQGSNSALHEAFATLRILSESDRPHLEIQLVASPCERSVNGDVCGHCGNGLVEDGESCDDGNTNQEDGCSNHCQTQCGDGLLAGLEECDDGNQENGDGCDAHCIAEQCIDENEPEICNGFDEDCDGLTDEDFNLRDDDHNCGACNVNCADVAAGLTELGYKTSCHEGNCYGQFFVDSENGRDVSFHDNTAGEAPGTAHRPWRSIRFAAQQSWIITGLANAQDKRRAMLVLAPGVYERLYTPEDASGETDIIDRNTGAPYWEDENDPRYQFAGTESAAWIRGPIKLWDGLQIIGTTAPCDNTASECHLSRSYVDGQYRSVLAHTGQTHFFETTFGQNQFGSEIPCSREGNLSACVTRIANVALTGNIRLLKVVRNVRLDLDDISVFDQTRSSFLVDIFYENISSNQLPQVRVQRVRVKNSAFARPLFSVHRGQLTVDASQFVGVTPRNNSAYIIKAELGARLMMTNSIFLRNTVSALEILPAAATVSIAHNTFLESGHHNHGLLDFQGMGPWDSMRPRHDIVNNIFQNCEMAAISFRHDDVIDNIQYLVGNVFSAPNAESSHIVIDAADAMSALEASDADFRGNRFDEPVTFVDTDHGDLNLHRGDGTNPAIGTAILLPGMPTGDLTQRDHSGRIRPQIAMDIGALQHMTTESQ